MAVQKINSVLFICLGMYGDVPMIDTIARSLIVFLIWSFVVHLQHVVYIYIIIVCAYMVKNYVFCVIKFILKLDNLYKFW